VGGDLVRVCATLLFSRADKLPDAPLNVGHYLFLPLSQQMARMTADVRLLVLLSVYDSGGGSVLTITGGGSVVHGARRAELAPAHAQRTVGIIDDWDRGLIGLRACQTFARTVSALRQD
jgi:hypothetical protein